MPPLTAKKISELIGIIGSVLKDDILPLVHLGNTQSVKLEDVSPFNKYNVQLYGASPTATPADNLTAFNAAIAAASAGGIVYVPRGVYNIAGSLVMSTSHAVIQGQGWDSILQFLAQTGACLDISNSVHSDHYQFGQVFEKFQIIGDGISDPGKTHCGIRLHGTYPNGFTFRDITIKNTGGPALKLETESNVNSFENISLFRPVDADINDVPYLHLYGTVNGNIFKNIFLRSISAAVDGLHGCVRLEQNPITHMAPSWNTFYTLSSEFMHIPENGSIVQVFGRSNVFYNFIDWDSVATGPGTTNTAVVRFMPSTEGDFFGSNQIYGSLPEGWAGGSRIRYGIIMEGFADRVEGTTWQNGQQVVLIKLGAKLNYVNISGRLGGPAILDSSGEENVMLMSDSGHAAFHRGAIAGVLINLFLTNEDATAATWSGETLMFGKDASVNNYSSKIIGYQNPHDTYASRLLLQTHAAGAGAWHTGMLVNEYGNFMIGPAVDAGALTADGSLAIDKDLAHQGTKLGFYNTAPVTIPTVAGAKGGNAALTSLMAALAALGLVVDTTT